MPPRSVRPGGSPLAANSILRSTALTVIVGVAVVVAIPLLIICVLTGIPWPLAPIIGLVAGVALVVPRLRNVEQAVLSQFSAVPADELRHARLLNLVEGLVLSIGLPEPEVRVLEDPALNAMAVVGSDSVTLIVTQGLLEALDRLELEGVVAELLVRAKDGDAAIGTGAASLIGGLFLDGPLGSFRAFGVSRLRAMLDDDRDLLADRAAVGVTRYPPALASAFVKMKSGELVPAGSTARVEHLWLVPPPRALVASHSLDLRIDVLQEI